MTAGSNYRNWHVTAVTPITFDDAFNYRFLLHPSRDLFFVKLAFAATRRVEVFSLTASSNYKTIFVTSSTGLPMGIQKATFGLLAWNKLMCVRKLVSVGTTAPSRRLNVAVVGYS